jgi:hypothetical protein
MSVLHGYQVCKLYPKTTAGFAPSLMTLLGEHHLMLEPSLRRGLVAVGAGY